MQRAGHLCYPGCRLSESLYFNMRTLRTLVNRVCFVFICVTLTIQTIILHRAICILIFFVITVIFLFNKSEGVDIMLHNTWLSQQ
jgi:hypothetical protein